MSRRFIAGIGALLAMFLTGCDSPAARDTVLQGAEAATTTLGTALIQALFEAFQEDEEQSINTV